MGSTQSPPSLLLHAHAPGLVLRVNSMNQSPPATTVESFSKNMFPHSSFMEPSRVNEKFSSSSSSSSPSPQFSFIFDFVFFLLESIGEDHAESASTGKIFLHPTHSALLRPDVGCSGKIKGRGRTMVDLHRLAPK